MPETGSPLREAQLAMAAHLRDPDNAPAPAIEDRRLQIYRGLIYNNIESFISSGFPVLRSLYEDDDWHRLVRSFVRDHRCSTPLFPQVSQEFLAYLMQEYQRTPSDPVFMAELAHYEWVELALDLAPDTTDPASIDASGDLLDGVPVVSPLAWSLAYEFPVHEIGPGFQPTEPGESPTFLIVYRDRSDQVRFMASNAATARLLELLQANGGDTGTSVLRQLAAEMGMAEEAVLGFGTDLLENLRRQSVVLGCRL